MGNNLKSGLPKGVVKKNYNLADMYMSTTVHDATDDWSSHQYPDDKGKTARDVFNISNNNALIDEIIKNHDEDIFEAWTRGDLMGTASKPYERLSYEERKLVRGIDKYTDRSELYQGIQVHSLASAEYLTGRDKYFVPPNLDAYMGKTFINEMPLSAAVAGSGLTIGRPVGIGRGKNVDYVFNIPPGKGYGMWVGDFRINSGWGDAQREFLISRDLVWMPKSYTVIPYVTPRSGEVVNIWQVQLELVARRKHRT